MGCGHHRDTSLHGLDGNHAEGLRLSGWHHRDVGRSPDAGNVFGEGQEHNVMGHASRHRLGCQAVLPERALPLRRVAHDGKAHAVQLALLTQQRNRLNQQPLALPVVQAPHQHHQQIGRPHAKLPAQRLHGSRLHHHGRRQPVEHHMRACSQRRLVCQQPLRRAAGDGHHAGSTQPQQPREGTADQPWSQDQLMHVPQMRHTVANGPGSTAQHGHGVGMHRHRPAPGQQGVVVGHAPPDATQEHQRADG